MITHLHDLAAPAVNLMPAAHLRAYVLADTALTLNLARFKARGILAAAVPPQTYLISVRPRTRGMWRPPIRRAVAIL